MPKISKYKRALPNTKVINMTPEERMAEILFLRDDNKLWKKMYLQTKELETRWKHQYIALIEHTQSIEERLIQEIKVNNHYRDWFTTHKHLTTQKPLTWEQLNPEPIEAQSDSYH